MMNFDVKKLSTKVKAQIASLSAESLGWLSVVLIHAATLPTMLAVLTGLSDKLPPADLVLLTWSGLVALFAQACLQKNMLQIVTIASGFILQAGMMVLIFFR